MAYHIEGTELVFDGFEKGISDSPYSGVGDMRNMNIISTPAEAMVNFATASSTLASLSASVVSADSGTEFVTIGSVVGTLQNSQAVVFSGGSLPGGLVAGTVYWISNVSGVTFKVYSDCNFNNVVNISGTGTGTVTSIDMGRPVQWSNSISPTTSQVNEYYALDANGLAWYFRGSVWVYLGNTTLTNAHGNGMVWYAGYVPAAQGYLFVFRDNKIDYMNVLTRAWTYGWQTLNAVAGAANSHYALVGQDNTVYYCDASFVGSFFQKVPSSSFDPGAASSYTWASQALRLPSVETSTWLTELGVSLLVSGQRNLIYPWDRTSASFSFPIFLAENNTQRMITVNTNAYLFTGDRGRIYTTNGTNARLFAKMPDHISGVEDPIYTWGAVGFNKNQMYFGVNVTDNAGVALTKYGGLWSIDMATEALRLTNVLSYGTYAGYATLFIPLSGTGNGTGFYVGWDNGASGYGIDVSTGSPYTNYQAYLETDMAPVGTYLKKKTFETFELKLSRPLVSGEAVKLYMRNNLSESFTEISKAGTDADFVGQMSVPFLATTQENNQWLQLKPTLKSTASSPSYVRLTQIRARAQL